MLYSQSNGMESPNWDITGRGKDGENIEDSARDGVDAYGACCYCLWNGPPTPVSKTYYVSLSGIDSNSCTSAGQSCRTIKSALTKAKNIVATDITIIVGEGE